MPKQRQAHLASRRRGTLLALLILISSAVNADRAAAQGAIIRPYTRRVSFNMPGDFLIIGSVNSVCATSRPNLGTNVASRCTNGRNGQGSADNLNNDNVFMEYFVDPSLAGMSAGGSAVFNGSTATLSLPADATVEFAGLYWAAAYQAGASTGSGMNQIPAGSAAPNANRRNTVYLKTPRSGQFYQVVATQFDEPTFDQAPDIYQGFTDVTQIVKDGGSGTYAIANMQIGTGRQKTGGWSLVVIFQSPTQPERNLTVFDGSARIYQDAAVNIPVSGFLTPPVGPVRTRLGMAAFEGDLGIVGDQFHLNNATLTDPPARPDPNNFFNSSISRFGANITNRTPNFSNAWGWDVTYFDAPQGLLGNNATSATITLQSAGDLYVPLVVAFATELFEVSLAPSVFKNVVDVNGGVLLPGDTLKYTVSITNATGDGADSLRVIDTLPPGTTFVRGSLAITSSTPANVTPVGAKTDAADGDIAEFDPTPNGGRGRVIFRLGAGATGATGPNANRGGLLLPSQAVSLTYSVVVNANTPFNTLISNQARVIYNGETLGEPHNDPTDGDPNTPGSQPTQIRVAEGTDLVITKTTVPPVIAVGTDVTFGITVRNAGGFSAQNVVVTDTIPAGMQFVSATSGAVPNANGVITFNIPSLAAGATENFTVVMRGTTVGTFRNAAAVTSTTPDPDLTNNHATANVQVEPPAADVEIIKTGPATAEPDVDIVYTIKVINHGPGVARNIVLTDTLDVQALFLAASGNGHRVTALVGGTPSQEVVWTIDSLEVGQSVTFDYTVRTPPRGGSLVDRASSTASTADPVPGNNDGSAPQHSVTTLVRAPSDLVVSKTGPPIVATGSTFDYTITVRNVGLSPATDVVVVDTLPAGLTFVSASGGGTHVGNIVTWPTFAQLLVNADTVFTVRVTASSTPGTFVDIAGAKSTSTDANPEDNKATFQTTVVTPVNVSVVKSAPATVGVGQDITYNVTVSNSGPNGAQNVVVTDSLPIGLTVVDAGGGVVSGSAATGFIITWPTIATLPANAPHTFTFVARAAAPGTFQNVGHVTTSTPETTLADNRSIGTTTVVPIIDLAITKVISAGTATEGLDITYALTVTKASSDVAANVVIADTLPAGTTFVSADAGGTFANGAVTWNVGTLGAGVTSHTVRVTVHIAPGTTSLRNVASVATSSFETDHSNNVFVLNTPVGVQGRDLVITKSAPPTQNAGSRFTYTLTATNQGQLSATNVVVTDTLPVGATFVSATDNPTVNGRILTWSLGTLAAGASRVLTVTVDAPAVGDTLVNVAHVIGAEPDPNLANNRDTAVVIIVPSADVSIEKTGPATVEELSNVSYTLTVRNAGPSPALNVVVKDTLPAGSTFVSATGGGTLSGNVVTWPAILSLASGASQTFTLIITAPEAATPAPFTDAAAATSTTPDPNPNNNHTRLTTNATPRPRADVFVRKTGTATVAAGGTITYTIEVDNSGPATAASVVVKDTLPAGVTFVSASNGGTLSSNVVTWPTIASLAPDDPHTFTVTVTAPANASSLVDIAAATTTTVESDLTNNRTTFTTTVTASADVEIEKTGPATAVVGTNVTYTLTVTNNGPSAAVNVVVKDTLPAGATFVSATGGGTISGNVVTWPAIASLASGASQSFTLVVTTPNVAEQFADIAAATSDTPDPNPNNNRTTLTTTAQPADLVVTKTGPATVVAGQQATYTIQVLNRGPAAAANVIVHDTLAAGVTFVSASNGGTLTGNVVTWPTIALLQPDAPQTFTVTVTAPVTAASLVDGANATTTTAESDLTNNHATFTTTVTASADVSIEKTGPATADVGTNVTYTLTVRNAGPSAAANVVVTDTLPAGSTFVSAVVGGTLSGNVVTWPTIPSLASGASQTFTLIFTAPNTPGAFNDAAAARSTTPDPNPNNNQTRVSTTGEPSDLVVTKTGPATVVAGQQATYTIQVLNRGPAAAANVIVHDTLAPGVTFVSASNGGTLSGNVVTWPTIPSLAPNAPQTFTVTVTAPANAGQLVDGANATTTTPESDLTNNHATFTTTVTASADVSIEKTGPATADAGTNVTYTLTVRNAGPSAAANVVVTDTLPAGSTFVSASGGGTLSGNVVTWPAIASLASGTSQTFTLIFTAPNTPGAFNDAAAARSTTPDPNPNNNQTRVSTTGQPSDLVVTKTGPATVVAGQQATYTIQVVNRGPAAAANVIVHDTLAAGVTFVSASNGGTLTGNVVTWPTIASLAPDDPHTFTVTVTAPANAGQLVDGANATTTTPESDLTNNHATFTTTVTASADVSIEKTGPTTAAAGSNVTYTLTVRNAGPSAAENVVVTDTLPAGSTFVSASGGGTLSGNVVTWPTIASLASGASQTFTLIFTAPNTPGAFNDAAAARSTTPDPNPNNNQSRVSTTGESSDLVVTKSGPATVVAGATITYTIQVVNHGPAAAASVVVHDTLAAGVTFANASGGGTLGTGNVVTWPTIPSLAPNAPQTFTVTVTAPANAGQLVDGANATTTTPESDLTNNHATFTTTVTASADVAIEKVGPATPPQIGGSVTYTLTVTNHGPSAAENVVVTDTLPAGATFVSASGGGTLAGRVVTWPAIASLASGAEQAFTLVITAPVTPGIVPFTNIAAATSATPDPNPGNNRGSVTITPTIPTADIAVVKTGPATVGADGLITYQLTVSNAGPSTAANVVLTDTLPAGVTFVSATGGGTLTGSVVTWPTIPALTNGASQVFTLVVRPPATAGSVTNIAGVRTTTTDPDLTNNRTTFPTTVTASADVSIEKTGPTTAAAGSNVTYTLTVRNAGPSAAENVVVTDTLPTGSTFVSASGGGTLTGNVVTWPTIPSLASGASATFTLIFTAPNTPGAFNDAAAARSTTPDPNPNNNQTRVSTTGEPSDLVVTKTGPATVVAGATITYTIQVVNHGPAAAASVVVHDTLAAGVTFANASGGGTLGTGNVVTWPTIPSLAPNAPQTFTVTVTAPANAGQIVDGANATTTTPESDLTNNHATFTTTVTASADVEIVKTGPPTTPDVGSNFTYTLTVRNNGPSTATNVVVTDTLPVGTTFVSATPTPATVVGRVVTWPTIASLPIETPQTFTLVVTAPNAVGAFTNSSAVTSATPDPNTTNNHSSVTITPTAADIAVAKTGPATVGADGLITYQLTVSNAGPAAAANVVLTDTLPAGVTFVSATGGGTLTGTVVTWPAIPTLASGANQVFTLVVRPPANAGTVTNAAAVTTTTGDPNLANNHTRFPTNVTAAADVAIVKDGPERVIAGTNVTYTLTVTNNGPSTAANVVVKDTLPAGATFVSASAGGTLAGTVVTWPTIATLAVGAKATFTLVVVAPNGPSFTNIAVATSTTPDPDPSNNRAVLVTQDDPAPTADVSITKSTVSTPQANAPLSYELTVANAGPAVAANVVLVDTIPVGTTFVSATGGGTLSGRVVTWPTIASLGAGENVSFVLVVTPPAAGGSVTNIAAVTTTTTDRDLTNNHTTLTTNVGAVANLAVTKTGPASAVVGDTVTYLITVHNNGPSAATSVVVSDTLPVNVTFVSADNGGTLAGRVVTWPAIASLANGASVTFSTRVVVSPSAATTVVNVAAVTSPTSDPDPTDNRTSVTTPLEPPLPSADLSMTKTGPATVLAGGAIEFTLRVSNLSTTAARDVRVTDTLPDGAVFLSASGGGVVEGHTVVWPVIPSLAGGAAAEFTLRIVVNSAKTIVNVANVQSSTPDPVPGNNTARTTTTVGAAADLVISKRNPAGVVAGRTTYTIVVHNLGPDPAENVVVTDLLPDQLRFESGTGGAVAEGQRVTFAPVASLGVNDSVVFNLVVSVAPGVANGTSVTNSAQVTSTTPDPDPTSNSAQVTTVINNAADLRIEKTGPLTAAVGDTVLWVITVRNNGPGIATGVRVADTLPAGVTFISATGGGTAAGRVVTWPTIDTLGVGGLVVFTATAVVTQKETGQLRNFATVRAASTDPNVVDDSASVNTQVNALADVAVLKTGPTTASPGEAITYLIRVFNKGPSAAIGVAVSDTLPANATFVSASGNGAAIGHVVQWPVIDRLEVGDTASFNVVAQMGSGSATAVNIAAATSITDDPVPANNNGSQPQSRVVTQLGQLDVAIRKRAVEPFVRGVVGRYILTVNNVGQATTNGPITVIDTLPAGLTFVRGGLPDTTGSQPWTCTANGQFVRCTNPNLLAPRDSVLLAIDALIGPATPKTIVNRAIVSTPGDTVPTGNNVAEVSVQLSAVEIPLLVIDKAVNKTVADVGDVVEYTLRIRNLTNGVIPSVVVTDTLPLGFQYLRGSARVDTTPVPDPIGAPGPRLRLPIGDIGANATVFVRYRARLGPAAPTGDGTNHAHADNGVIFSNAATATVKVQGGVFSERGFIVGRVFLDPPDLGIPGVRVYLEDGTGAVTDGEGKYSFVGISPRMHIVKVDLTTLPDSAKLLATSTRNAGDGASQFVDLFRWEMARADFVVADAPYVRAAVVALRKIEPPGEATMRLGQALSTLTDTRTATTGAAVQRPDPDRSGMPRDTTRLGATEPRFQPLAGSFTVPVGEASQLSASPFDSTRAQQRPVIRLTMPVGGVPADGHTVLRVGVHVDRAAFKNVDSIPITLEATRGRWLVTDRDSTLPGVQTFIAGDSATFELIAPAREGNAVIRVTSGPLADKGEVDFLPASRPIILAGVLDGRIDLRSLSRGSLVSVTPNDAFQDELSAISTGDGADRAGARAALFLRGKIKGDALLTISYDSDRQPDQQTFRDIQPEQFYPVYGDASQSEFQAQTAERLYVRLDKERSFVMYGDYLTPAVSRARELGAYMRTFTGGAAHTEGKYGEVSAFSSRENASNLVNELRGLGTSGPYVLSSTAIRLNTEQVEIITRDRTQPSRVLRIVPQERFVDYIIEPFTGTLYFRRPVPSLDEDLNPVSVRVTFQLDRDIARYWVYGIDGALRPTSFLEVGGNAVRDDDPINARRLYSANATLKIGESTVLTGEWAHSNSDSIGGGNAGRFDLRHRSKWADIDLFGVSTDSTFDNPSSTAIRDRSEFGLRSAFSLTKSTRLLADVVRSENRFNDGRLTGAQVSVEQKFNQWWRLELGGQWSKWTDSAYNPTMTGVPGGSLNAARGRLTATLPGSQPGSVYAEYAQNVGDADARRFDVGGEYWLDRRLKLYGRTEFLNSLDSPYPLNDQQGRSNTVLGMDAQWLRTGQVYSEYRLNDALTGRDGQAVIGLRNRWTVAPGLAIDGTFERTKITEGEQSLASEGTAVTGAIEYTRPENWKGTARLEVRDGRLDNAVVASLGYALRLNREFTFLGRGLWSEAGNSDQQGRGELGLAWRGLDEGKWNALARVEQLYQNTFDNLVPTIRNKSNSTVFSTHLNYQPIPSLTFMPMFAVKASHDKSSGVDDAATTYLTQLRGLYDLTRDWDVGATGSLFGADAGLGTRFGLGGEIGRRLVNNLRAAAGYNVFGFRDASLFASDYTMRGPYFRIDYKFDESLLGLFKSKTP